MVIKTWFLSKSSKVCVVSTIRFYSKFTGMWYKHFLRAVWRDFRFPMSNGSTEKLEWQIYCKNWFSDRALYVSIASSSWAWFFSLFFIRKFHIELCHSRSTTYFAAPKKSCHFHIWYPLTIYSLPNKTLKYALSCTHLYYHFFHIIYNPISTHSIKQNN